MKKVVFSVLFMLFISGAIPENAFSQSVENETSGIETIKPDLSIRGAVRAMDGIPAGGVLLIPESTNKRVMAFDPLTGNLVDANFIPADDVNLTTPIEAILSADGQSILVSDQVDDVVQEYDLEGNYIGVFAPAGGVNNAILDNIRGIALRPNGNLLVSVGGGANTGNIAEFDINGNYLGVFISGAAAGGTSPFDVFLRNGTDYLVAEINADKIYKANLSGAYTGDLAPVNNFPEQICQTPGGNILVGNFSGTQEGVVELTSAGALVGVYSPAGLAGFRGVYELPNGNILTTTGTGVYEIDRMGNIIEAKITSVSARFITYIPGQDPNQIPLSPWMILLAIALIATVVVFRYRR